MNKSFTSTVINDSPVAVPFLNFYSVQFMCFRGVAQCGNGGLGRRDLYVLIVPVNLIGTCKKVVDLELRSGH